MKMRKTTSLIVLLSFILLVLTSVILYIVPQGRVAYWADWRLLGLTKTQWGNLHLNLGLLFLLSIFLHIYYNWKPILSYFKDKAKKIKVFTKDFNVALALVSIFVFGTYLEIPPFSSFLALSDSIKETAAEKYGEPPYGHAELSSVKTFTKRMGIDLKESMALLRKAGFKVEDEKQTLAEISRINNISPQQVYMTMKPTALKSLVYASQSKKLPDSPPVGTGNLTLADLCSQHNLNMKVIIRGLAKQSISAREDMTVKKIAEENQVSPIDIYENIKTIASIEVSPQAFRTKKEQQSGNRELWRREG